MNEPRFWVAVASLDHVEQCVCGGYIEINHGKATPLARMAPGDGVVCYSPRLAHPAGALLQSFTAMGRVAAAPMVQSPLAHQPFRRQVAWLAATAAPVRPLLPELGFLANRTNWGVAFRFGFLRIARDDFLRVAQAMACAFPQASPPAPALPPATPGHPGGIPADAAARAVPARPRRRTPGPDGREAAP